MKTYSICYALLSAFSFFGFACKTKTTTPNPSSYQVMPMSSSVVSDSLETITLGGGCFWCIEAVFEELKGVASVSSGYTGGAIKNPTYRAVCSGTTGHAEVIQVVYDTNVLSTADLLRVFFTVHDPTTLNRQGNDSGTQYRSAIYFHDDAQRVVAEKMLAEAQINEKDPIVTEITKMDVYYVAEDYHQEYYKLNGTEPYCSYVISPKMAKFRKEWKDRLKSSGQ
jgi:peptide-methionine (S)-S-oxide reductase